MKRMYELLKAISDKGGLIKYDDIKPYYKNTRSQQRIISKLNHKKIIKIRKHKPLFEGGYKAIELTDYGYHILKILQDLYT